MFCRYCGKSIPDTAKFCRFCGKPLQVNDENLSSFADRADNSQTQADGVEAPTNRQKSRMSKKKKIALIVAAVIVVTAIIVACICISAAEKRDMLWAHNRLVKTPWECEDLLFTTDENGYPSVDHILMKAEFEESGDFYISGSCDDCYFSAYGIWEYDYRNKTVTMRYPDGTTEYWGYPGSEDYYSSLLARTDCVGFFHEFDLEDP